MRTVAIQCFFFFYHTIYTDIPECSALILRFILWHITPDSIVCSGQVTLKFSVFLYSEPSFLYIDCLFGLFTEDSIALSLDEEAFSLVTDKRKWSWEIKTNEEERDGKTALIVAPLKIGKVKWVFGWLLFLYNHFVHIAFFCIKTHCIIARSVNRPKRMYIFMWFAARLIFTLLYFNLATSKLCG